MRTWLRLMLITMTVGGGFAGLTLAVSYLPRFGALPPLGKLILLFFIALHCFVVAAGLLFVQFPGKTAPMAIALAFQVPRFSSPIVAYKFMTAWQFYVGFSDKKFAYHIDFIGSEFGAELNQPSIPLGFQINLVALVLLILILRSRTPPLLPSTK